MTVCLYLPDGRVGFMFKRPEIANNDAFDAGGMTFDVVDAVRGADGRLRGQGRAARRPARRWPTRRRRSPRTRTPSARSHITFTGQGRPTCSAASPTSPTRRRARSSPRATTSSSSPARARSASATRSGTIDGFGLRDHSWGPRYWQAPWYYRWLTANFGGDFGFMGSRVARQRRRRAPVAASCGRTASCTSATTFEIDDRVRAATTATTRRSRPCCARRGRQGVAGHAARC